MKSRMDQQVFCPTNERVLSLDAIRGFALLGIMFVNMTWFTGYAVLGPDEKQSLTTWKSDEFVHGLIEVFIAGKFWTIFAIMFGVGVGMQFKKFENQPRKFLRIYLRRVAILLILGLVHGAFLWFGDIVSLYAASAFVLPWFISKTDRARFGWAIFLLLLPIGQVGIWLLLHQLQGMGGADPGHGPAELLPVFATGTYFEVFLANWEFLKERWLIAIMDGRFLKLSGLFLIGWHAGKHDILARPREHKKLLFAVVAAALLVGVPANVVAFTWFPGVTLRPPSFAGWLVESIKAIGVPILGIGYVAAIALWAAYRPKQVVPKLFAIAGRLSLTNYVLQSAVGVVIFYGYGFGLWGHIGTTWSILLIILIFSAQVIFSRIWLYFFRLGPLEWVWRCLAYGQLFPIRHAGSNRTPLTANNT